MLEALNVIESRTLNGDKVGGGKFQRYSPEYAERKGVTPDSVDLFLDGGMLESLTPISETRNTVTFGIIDGDEAPKAYNHHVGDTLPERPWFGITSNEAKMIIDRIKKDDINEEQEMISLSDTARLKMIIDELLNNDFETQD